MPPPRRLVLLGEPVAHSLSPIFQRAALQAAGIAATYEAMAVSANDIEGTLRSLVAEGAAGNVTIPHKERVAALCDSLSPLAARLGAVNTWWSTDGILHGDNTDGGGFDDAIRSMLGEIPRNARVAVLGAGGSARAVVSAIGAWHNCSVALWGRSIERAAAVAPLGPTGRTTVEEFMAHAIRGADLVVNATPIGMRDDQVPVNPAVLRAGAACFDLVYRRKTLTPFIALARAQGRLADDGLGMLIAQGARSFRCWFGVEPDRAIMRAAISDT